MTLDAVAQSLPAHVQRQRRDQCRQDRVRAEDDEVRLRHPRRGLRGALREARYLTLLNREVIVEVTAEEDRRHDDGGQHRRLVQGDAARADGEVAEDQQHPSGSVQGGVQQREVNRGRRELSHRLAQLAEVVLKDLLAGSVPGWGEAPEVAADRAVAIDDNEVRVVVEFVARLALVRGLLLDADLEAPDEKAMNVLLLPCQKEPFGAIGMEVASILL